MTFSLLHPRDQIVATMDRIYAHDMTTTSGGNISVKDENGDVWITPARVDKGSLRRQDVVRIRPDAARMASIPLVGVPFSPRNLQGPARCEGGDPRPPGRAGELQHVRAGAGYAGIS